MKKTLVALLLVVALGLGASAPSYASTWKFSVVCKDWAYCHGTVLYTYSYATSAECYTKRQLMASGPLGHDPHWAITACAKFN